MSDLPRRVIRALLWLAAFFFATGLFLALTQLLRALPPTAPVAVGAVTIQKASKLRDYATELLFFLVVPLATLLFHRLGERENERLRRHAPYPNVVSLLFVAPFFLAPFLYLTTFKWGWPIFIPLGLALAIPRVVIVFVHTRWLRALFVRDMLPFHALIATEGLAWILFRYIAVARRIAHVPTLFLEIVFVLFFLIVFWSALVLIARVASLTIDIAFDVALQRISVAALPMVILPALAIRFVAGGTAIALTMPVMLVAIVVALRRRDPIDGRAVRNLVAFALMPFLLYCASYASTASLTQWIDLFHRGESFGPASDYLRGKAPYRDVFVLHGLLDDGQLDAWLMQLFGRHVEIALARPAVIGSFAVPALWLLGMALFDSMPLALLTVILGAVTTVDNERIFFEIAVLMFLLFALRRNARWMLVVAGIFAAVALFFSLDIGMYSIAGALLTIAIATRDPRPAARFLIGIAIGAAPFLIYLATRQSLLAFANTSFVALPRYIDAVWSTPFPDLTTTFRRDLTLRSISDFVLTDQFRFILNPLVIAMALIALIRRRETGLLGLTCFAILTQRSALGRADFPHQYFSAFLIGPMLVALLVRLAGSARKVWNENDRAAQTFLVLSGAVLLPMLIVALWVPDIANLRLDDTVRYIGRVRGWLPDAQATEIRNRISDVGYNVAELSPPGRPIFDFSNQPALYFFMNRPNPTRFYQVPILSPVEYQRETILSLERARPMVVLRNSPQEFDAFDGIENEVRAQAVAAYIDDHYEYARSARGIEIWKRKDGLQPPLNLAGYMRRIRIPTAKELASIGARSRLVFPSIGSTPGAGDTFWRTDLVLHNPFKEVMTVGLRYVAGDIRIDRGVPLAGGQSIRWEDVVKSLFRAPDSRGALWIDYRGAHAPVARIKTYDSAHSNARAAVASPLSARDAASAGAENSELTVVGIPGGTGRRINIGVINVGQIPATFRISIHTRSGQRIGKTIEQGLPESESYLLNDAEKELGVPLDESVTLHVTMVAGSGIAYATVVDNSGDNQFLAAIPAPQP